MPREPRALPDQALPPDKRKKIPPPFEDTLPSGLKVAWRMPDVFSIISFDGVLPDPLTSAVIRLLTEEKAYTPEADPKKFRYDAESIRGMYGLAAAMLETPKLDAGVEYGDGNGTLGRREIGYLDVTALYWRFRIGTRQAARAPAAAPEPGGAADAAPDRGDLPPDAGGAGGGE